jgi:TPR repeat protein
MKRLLICLAILALMPVAPAALAQAQEQAAPSLDSLPFDKKLKLAKVGDEDAQMQVAMAYETGTGVGADLAEAAKWFRQAALAGNMDAQFRLAGIVAKGAKGLTKDQATAFKLYETAANRGHAPSQNALGQIHQTGDGVPKDEAKAFIWYQKAADQKYAVAENNLGIMYLNGQGVDRNLAEAVKLFARAAAQRDVWGLNNLGGMYEMGWGVPKDVEKAKGLYRQAAEAGNKSASQNLLRLGVTPAASAPAN